MPETGKYEKLPRPESIATFLKYVDGNRVVHEIEKYDKQVYLIKRWNKHDLKIYLTNVYIVGIADVHEILALEPNIQAIVTLSAWNSYSSEAKEFCKSRKIGLFQFSEFLGAVYYEGSKFLDYTSPE